MDEGRKAKRIGSVRELEVYRLAFDYSDGKNKITTIKKYDYSDLNE